MSKINNKFINSINILDGKIVYNEFDIYENIPFKKQEYSFKEDILQIEFGNRFILDVGWIPEHNPKGFFVIQAIQDYDWQKPLSREKCRTFKDLKIAIEKAVQLINSIRKIKDLPFKDIEY